MSTISEFDKLLKISDVDTKQMLTEMKASRIPEEEQLLKLEKLEKLVHVLLSIRRMFNRESTTPEAAPPKSTARMPNIPTYEMPTFYYPSSRFAPREEMSKEMANLHMLGIVIDGLAGRPAEERLDMLNASGIRVGSLAELKNALDRCTPKNVTQCEADVSCEWDSEAIPKEFCKPAQVDNLYGLTPSQLVRLNHVGIQNILNRPFTSK